jgi:hypothetical protein
MPPNQRDLHHPHFSRITSTQYYIESAGNYLPSTVHVGQLADFLNFDERMRDAGGIHQLQAMPLGYLEFAAFWNEGVQLGDARRFSTFSYPEGSEQPIVTISTVPVPAADFSITREQVGLRTLDRGGPYPVRTNNQPRASPQPRNPRPGNDSPGPRRNNCSGNDRRRQQPTNQNTNDNTGPLSISDLSRIQFRAPRNRVVDQAASSSSDGSGQGVLPQAEDNQDTTMEEILPMQGDAQSAVKNTAK